MSARALGGSWSASLKTRWVLGLTLGSYPRGLASGSLTAHLRQPAPFGRPVELAVPARLPMLP
jgi:hypothetical protein